MRLLRWSALPCVLLIACSVQAQEHAPIDFTEAARRTLAAHPQFERFALALKAAQSRVAAAALRTPLELSAEAENIAGSGDLEGAGGAELTLSLTSIVERGSKRAARVDAAEQAVRLLSVEQRIEMLDLLAESGRRFVALAVAQEALERAQARATQSHKTVALIAERVAAARSPKTEQLSAELEDSTARLALANAQRQLDAARFALASQWAQPTKPVTVAIDFFTLPVPISYEALASALEQAPDLERFAAERALRDAQLRLARAQAVTDWRWSLGVRRLEDVNDQALVAGLSIPLATRRRNRPLIEEAELERAQVPLSQAARRLELQALLHEQWQLLETARATIQAIESEQLPRAREALELTERGYRIGRFAYRDLAVAQQQRLTLDVQRLEVAAQYHLTRIEIERLTGAQIALLKGTTP